MSKELETTISYDQWESSVIDNFAELTQMPYSDAQGVVEANSFYLAQSWAKGLDADKTAHLINDKSQMKTGGNVYVDVQNNDIVYSIGKNEQGIWTIFSECKGEWDKRDEFPEGFASEEDAILVAKGISGITPEFEDGGNIENSEALEFFKSLDYSRLPQPFSEFIQTEVLPDTDLPFLSTRELAYIELKEKIEKYLQENAPAEPESEEKLKIKKEIADLQGLKEFVSGAELDKVNKEIEDLEGLLSIL